VNVAPEQYHWWFGKSRPNSRRAFFLTAVSGLVAKIGDEPMVRKWRSRASRQVLIGDQLKTANALGSEVPPMLLGRDKHGCLLAILELLGHGRLWVKSAVLILCQPLPVYP